MKTHHKKPRLIPKPRGSVGHGLKLRKEMKLTNNRQLYLDCLTTVRDLCLAGRLDWKKGIKEQDVGALGDLYELARTEQPYLARFENDWATAQILIQFMANRRKNALNKGRVVATRDADGRRILKTVKVVRKVAGEDEDAGEGTRGASDGDSNQDDLGEDNGLDNGYGDDEEDPGDDELEYGDGEDVDERQPEDDDEPEDENSWEEQPAGDDSGPGSDDDSGSHNVPPAKRRKIGNVLAV
ncbi:hypothetical protein C8Q70DRAFT_1053617 [Cubamyces menziesii]|nr:hypothetical protein C8Q70DRAFT_1053617 [Cubamyces menziesii]